MTDQILSETVIPFEDASEHLPGRPTRPTLNRWAELGKLGFVRVGSRKFTSVEECRRFIDRCTAAPHHRSRVATTSAVAH